jgi:hypothetical protein
MAEAVYALCALASMACAALLFRSYLHNRLRLSLWTMMCFLALAANNVFLFVDLAVVLDVDFAPARNSVALVGVMLLLYAMITEGS